MIRISWESFYSFWQEVHLHATRSVFVTSSIFSSILEFACPQIVPFRTGFRTLRPHPSQIFTFNLRRDDWKCFSKVNVVIASEVV